MDALLFPVLVVAFLLCLLFKVIIGRVRAELDTLPKPQTNPKKGSRTMKVVIGVFVVYCVFVVLPVAAGRPELFPDLVIIGSVIYIGGILLSWLPPLIGGVIADFVFNNLQRNKGDKMKKGKKQEKETTSSQVPEPVRAGALPEAKTDLGNLNYSDAKVAAEGKLKSWGYRRQLEREAKNIKAEIETDGVVTQALKEKTERLKATKVLLKESGQVDQLPERERKEASLEDMKLETEMMRLQKEQAELAREIRELEKEDEPQPSEPPSQDEIYAKAMEEEQKKLEHELAMQAMQEMMVLKRMTEQARYIMEWEEEIREKYPDMAEDIFDAFERLRVEDE